MLSPLRDVGCTVMTTTTPLTVHFCVHALRWNNKDRYPYVTSTPWRIHLRKRVILFQTPIFVLRPNFMSTRCFPNHSPNPFTLPLWLPPIGLSHFTSRTTLLPNSPFHVTSPLLFPFSAYVRFFPSFSSAMIPTTLLLLNSQRGVFTPFISSRFASHRGTKTFHGYLAKIRFQLHATWRAKRRL